MPLQAFPLRKNRRGTSPVSKISDNEHTAPSLWDGTRVAVHSDELSVKHSPGEPIPEFAHAPEDGTKVPSASRRQDAGDVLPDQPAGPQAVSQPKILEGQVATVVAQSSAQSCDGEGLAGGSADQKVDWRVHAFADRREVAMKRNLRKAVLEN
jgi:hypothetical protein